jgi:RNase P protein component
MDEKPHDPAAGRRRRAQRLARAWLEPEEEVMNLPVGSNVRVKIGRALKRNRG